MSPITGVRSTSRGGLTAFSAGTPECTFGYS